MCGLHVSSAAYRPYTQPSTSRGLCRIRPWLIRSTAATLLWRQQQSLSFCHKSLSPCCSLIQSHALCVSSYAEPCLTLCYLTGMCFIAYMLLVGPMRIRKPTVRLQSPQVRYSFGIIRQMGTFHHNNAYTATITLVINHDKRQKLKILQRRVRSTIHISQLKLQKIKTM